MAYSRLRPCINPKSAHGHARNWPSCMRPCTGMTNGFIKCPFETNMDVEWTYVMSIQHQNQCEVDICDSHGC